MPRHERQTLKNCYVCAFVQQQKHNGENDDKRKLHLMNDFISNYQFGPS